MKKISIAIFTMLFLVTTIGVRISYHFCGGHISSVQFFASEKQDQCPCGVRKMSRSCCEDKTTTIKLADQFRVAQKYICPVPADNSLCPHPKAAYTGILHSFPYSLQHVPGLFAPRLCKPDLYLLNRVFLI